jgi:FKBP-type peptidyl-prolyl cis-trans isomerase 2
MFLYKLKNKRGLHDLLQLPKLLKQSLMKSLMKKSSTDDPQSGDLLAQLVQQKQGNLLAFEYILRLDNGEIAESNVSGEPMIVQLGDGQLPPALEQALAETGEGETVTVALAPEQAYGPRSEAACRQFALEEIPAEARAVGRKLAAQAPDGSEYFVEVIAIEGDRATIDFNHPLAGQTLHYEIRVLNNEPCA